jgi:hypothetical protein
MVHVPQMFLSERREFTSAHCLAGKKNLNVSSRQCFVEIARFSSHASFLASVTRNGLQLGTLKDPLSNDSIDSVPRYREVGRAKDL